jgi:hypothetical protein
VSDDFDWSKDDSVVVKSVRGLAVYRNSEGDVVIRQERGAYDEDDPFVVVPVIEVAGLIKKLEQAVSDSWESDR